MLLLLFIKIIFIIIAIIIPKTQQFSILPSQQTILKGKLCDFNFCFSYMEEPFNCYIIHFEQSQRAMRTANFADFVKHFDDISKSINLIFIDYFGKLQKNYRKLRFI